MSREEMKAKATVILPRHVFGKDRERLGGYMRLVCNPVFDQGLLEIVSRAKKDFNWPKEFSGDVYPDCYGLYRVDNDRYFLLRFHDDGHDEFKRPHTINYEAVLCDVKDGDIHDKSLRLASFLDSRARREADVVAFSPVVKPDRTLVGEIEDWLKKNTGELYINTPVMPASATRSLSIPETPKAPKVSTPPVWYHNGWYLIILSLCLVVSLGFNCSKFLYTKDEDAVKLATAPLEAKIGALEKEKQETAGEKAELLKEVERVGDNLNKILSDIQRIVQPQ
ncbi:hypothetical protein AGMMS50276_30740 [Synergistales bacterium]|nr:hypothetical protein AGMMS50276_30740 [Synergistales bacterium]